MQIKQAKIHDVEEIYLVLCDMLNNVDVEYGPPLPEKAIPLIAHTIQNGVCFIAEVDDFIIGTIGGEVGVLWHNNQTYLGDRWWYTMPEYRSTRAGLLLLRAFLKHADENNLPVILESLSGTNVERLDKVYKKYGLRHVGSMFMKGM